MRTETYAGLTVGTLATGLPLRIAIHEIDGDRDGPTVGISASVHGDEVTPVEAVRRLLAEISPADISGKLVVAPVVNPLAFQSHTRHTPQDMQNLNRVFPGDADGWLTEQLGRKFVDEFLEDLDVLLDLHAGGALATVDYAYIDNDENLSRTFDTPILYRGPGYQGTLSAEAVLRGIRCVVTEFGGGLIADQTYIERTVAGLRNALCHVGMLDGEVIDFGPKKIVDELAVIRPHHGGLLVPEIGIDRIGDRVDGGTLLGTVVNAQTFEPLEEIRAPFERSLMVLLRGVTTRIEAGDYAYIIANG
ncbi:MAG: succinylglutamate desuccinylase/aspartoacylase family protein [Thermomicrobiales bacterium]